MLAGARVKSPSGSKLTFSRLILSLHQKSYGNSYKLWSCFYAPYLFRWVFIVKLKHGITSKSNSFWIPWDNWSLLGTFSIKIASPIESGINKVDRRVFFYQSNSAVSVALQPTIWMLVCLLEPFGQEFSCPSALWEFCKQIDFGFCIVNKFIDP